MRVSVKIGNSRVARDTLRDFAQRADVTANRAGDIMAERLIEIIRGLIIGGAKTGRVYRRYNPRRIHQASAPGQPPANDLGRLANSFEAVQTKLNQYAYSNTVGSSLIYAAALQYGNPETNLLPRPYFDVALRQLRTEVDSILSSVWRATA